MSISKTDPGPVGLSSYLATPTESTVTSKPAAVNAPLSTSLEAAPEAVQRGSSFHDELLSAPVVSEDAGRFVESASQVLVGLRSDEARGDLYAILALLLRISQSQRTSEREVRHAGYEAQASMQYDAAQKVRESADERMWGGIIAATGQVIGGIAMMGGGAVSIGAGVKAASAASASSAALAKDDKGLADALTNAAEKWRVAAQSSSVIGQGASELSGASTRLTQTFYDKDAAEFEAQKIELDASGRKQEQVTQEVNEHMQQLLDAIRDVLDKLRSMEQSRQEINRGIARSL